MGSELVLIIEEPEELVYDEPEIEPVPPPLSEVEYWWDTPTTNGTNGAHHHDQDTTAGWLPEPEIRQRW